MSLFVNNLRVIQDKMEKHVSSVVLPSIALCQQNLWPHYKFTTEACRSLIQSTVTSRLDYCNVLLHNLPKNLLNRLQLVQNSCARLITGTRRHEHITPVLIELHWLPVESRIRYKVLLHTFKALKGQAPDYLCDLVKKYKPTRTLRSSSKALLTVPSYRTETYGSRSFRVAAPVLWNSVSHELRTAPTLRCFKKILKTYLFKEAYNLWFCPFHNIDFL